MQPLLKYLAFFVCFLPVLSLAVTALAPTEVELGHVLEPVGKSLALRQEGSEIDLEDIDFDKIDFSGVLDLIGPVLDFLKPQTFEDIVTILRNAAALLSDENTEFLVGAVGAIGDILTPELVGALKDFMGALDGIVGNLDEVIGVVLRLLFGGGGGGDDGGGDDGGDVEDPDSDPPEDDGDGGFEWPDNGGDDNDDGDSPDSPDSPDAPDAPDSPEEPDGGGDDSGDDSSGSDDGGDDGGIGGDDSSDDDSGIGGDDNPGGDDSSGGNDGGDESDSGSGPQDFDGAATRADPVVAASFALFAGALGVMMV